MGSNICDKCLEMIKEESFSEQVTPCPEDSCMILRKSNRFLETCYLAESLGNYKIIKLYSNNEKYRRLVFTEAPEYYDVDDTDENNIIVIKCTKYNFYKKLKEFARRVEYISLLE